MPQSPQKRAYDATYRKANTARIKVRNAMWYVANREQRRAYNKRYKLRQKYGLTVSDWEALFAQQQYRCAGCKSVLPHNKRGWATDHDHATGKIRGILCSPCNSALGYARDDVNRLLGLVAYLREQP